MKPEIIVALDYSDIKPVREIVKKIGSAVSWYKVGLELFVSCGHEALEFLKTENKNIFLDLKFHDIPNTVAGALSSSLKYGVDMVNVHAQGGVEMMKTAADSMREECAKKGVKAPLVIAVTLLTSLDEKYLEKYNIGFSTPADYVLHLAKAVREAGLDGVVSSAKETGVIKTALGADFITVTPGIRPLDSSADDQKRVVTPADAKKLGTDYIVVGRPITKAEDPYLAADRISEEMR
ncbi:orotidine-5'-phosphate decarboxylase [Geovibrio thiophilus]|uniref:Orotidine 5'-phosphate decarboxylase n=1 Tax=Geovibrio thiophilus TaxID=139438 RepID=A0A410JZL9_9BACT|nr:orotidine-5'-phosphate decarboxylase [Geovibrio thiophilus]QAR33583.1 orotidine-5'-phosphate decarboxylase [Geovibrio thiophilus]